MGIGYLKNIGYRDTVDMIVVAFCKDYFFRKEAIANHSCSKRTCMEYAYINERIADAAREIVGDDYEIFIKEIGSAVGYAKSGVLNIAECGYKHYKKQVKVNIAKKLHLID